MTLHTEISGMGSRVILAHGFTQNVKCWGSFGRHMARTHNLMKVDAPGHGRSQHDDVDLWRSAELHVEAAGRGIYLGYSMGGRMALHAALAHPESVTGLVLVGATAGIDDAAQRRERRDADQRLAQQITNDGLSPFLDRWLAGPLFATLDDEAAAKEHRLTNRPEGLASSLLHCGTGTQEPLWDRLSELTMPILLVVGAQDKKFTAIANRMIDAMTSAPATIVSLPGSHAIHLEQPEATADRIAEHLSSW